MHRRKPILLRNPLLPAVLVLKAVAASAALALPPDELCLDASRRAAEETGVPLTVLLALTLTETGRAGPDGGLEPWAWALNRGGDGHWFDNRDDALTYLEQALAEGSTNIDVGCFQLNYRWHGAAFASLEQMMDPAANARYAAEHVAGLYRRTGDWVAAAAAYHSQTPEHAERYLGRFEPIYAALKGMGPDALPPAHAPDREDPVTTRENTFPLLRAGASATAGSIVPSGGAVAPLFGGS